MTTEGRSSESNGNSSSIKNDIKSEVINVFVDRCDEASLRSRKLVLLSSIGGYRIVSCSKPFTKITKSTYGVVSLRNIMLLSNLRTSLVHPTSPVFMLESRNEYSIMKRRTVPTLLRLFEAFKTLFYFVWSSGNRNVVNCKTISWLCQPQGCVSPKPLLLW